MKILIFALDYKPNFGGIAEYTHQMAHNLQIEGNEIIVLTKVMPNSEDFDRNCIYKVVRVRDHFSRGRLGSGSLFCFLQISKYIKRFSPELLIGNQLSSYPHIFFLLKRIYRIPYCFLSHGFDVTKRRTVIGRLKISLGVRYAQTVFCNSNYTRSQVVKRHGSHIKTYIVFPGLSQRFIEEANLRNTSQISDKINLQNKRVILSLGRLVKRKGFDSVIVAMKIVQQLVPNSILIIAGEGPEEAFLKALVRALQLDDHVFFSGPISDKEKHAFYTASEIFVMPNRVTHDGSVEGFGIVFLEANAHGKPVIGGLSGGVMDSVAHNNSGLLVNPFSIKEIAEAIIVLLTNKTYANCLGQKGKQRVQESFSWTTIAQKLQNHLQSINYGKKKTFTIRSKESAETRVTSRQVV